MKLPPTVDLRITGRCNMACNMCFGPLPDAGDVNVSKLINLIKEFPSLGVENVVISGGEPLLIERFQDILYAAKHSGLKVILSTNGILLKDCIDDIAPYIDWLGLPLDADCPEIHARIRGGYAGHFALVKKLIELVRNRHPHMNIKLGTVACKTNRNNIIGIPEIIGGKHKPDIWKLYQIIYCENNFKYRNELQLSDAEYVNIQIELAHPIKHYNIKTVFYSPREREAAYLFLDPQGEAVVVNQGKELVIGNFFDSMSKVISRWPEYVSVSAQKHNISSTYP